MATTYLSPTLYGSETSPSPPSNNQRISCRLAPSPWMEKSVGRRSTARSFRTCINPPGEVGDLVGGFKFFLVRDLYIMISELGLDDFLFPGFPVETKIVEFFHHLSLGKIPEVSALGPAAIVRKPGGHSVKSFSLVYEVLDAVNLVFGGTVVQRRLPFLIHHGDQNMAGTDGIRHCFFVNHFGQDIAAIV